MDSRQSREKPTGLENEGDDLYQEYLRDKSCGNFQFVSYEELLNEQQDTERHGKSAIEKQNMAEKVGGVWNNSDRLQSHPEGGENVINSHIQYPKTQPDDLVRDLESHFAETKLPPRIRKALLGIASINIREHRGATVLDLENSGVNKHNAEKILSEVKKLGLVNVCEKRAAKMYQYVLSNYSGIIESKVEIKNKKQPILPNNICLLLAQELSHRNYVYHNIGLETRLNYKEDYDLIKWNIPSQRNKQKVHCYKIDMERNCTFILSTTGTLSLTLGCTFKPYSFHTAEGLMELFVTCGQILNLLQLSADNRINIVPNVGEWNLIRFDYNKDISTLELQEKYPSIRWNSREVLKLRYLANIFQIYSKEMSFEGNVLRAEGHYTTKNKRKFFDISQDILSNPDKHPFTTVEDMLKNSSSLFL